MSETDSARLPFSLCIEGDMTIYRAAALKSALLHAVQQHPRVEADLSAVTDIDSSGLQLLYLAQREAGRLGHAFHITASSHSASSLIHAFNLPQLLASPPHASADIDIDIDAAMVAASEALIAIDITADIQAVIAAGAVTTTEGAHHE